MKSHAGFENVRCNQMRHFGRQGQQFTLPSMTVPDQVMSLKEILDRFARGLPLDGEKLPVWDGEDDYFPDLSKMDLVDRQEYLEATRQEIDEIRARYAPANDTPPPPPDTEPATP